MGKSAFQFLQTYDSANNILVICTFLLQVLVIVSCFALVMFLSTATGTNFQFRKCHFQRRYPSCVIHSSDCGNGEKFVSNKFWLLGDEAECCDYCVTVVGTYTIIQYTLQSDVGYSITLSLCVQYPCVSEWVTPGCHGYRVSVVRKQFDCCDVTYRCDWHGNHVIMSLLTTPPDGSTSLVITELNLGVTSETVFIGVYYYYFVACEYFGGPSHIG